jgi:regulatory protein
VNTERALTAEEEADRALALGYRYLGRRERTRQELAEHLETKGVDAGLIELTVTALADQGYVDDARFARLFAQDKRELEGWGRERITRSLRQRGLERSLIEAAVCSEDREDELGRAVELLRRRFPEPPVEARAHERALAFLLRKGYESELALDALRAHARFEQRSGIR